MANAGAGNLQKKVILIAGERETMRAIANSTSSRPAHRYRLSADNHGRRGYDHNGILCEAAHAGYVTKVTAGRRFTIDNKLALLL